jgi:hypothetical protein
MQLITSSLAVHYTLASNAVAQIQKRSKAPEVGPAVIAQDQSSQDSILCLRGDSVAYH